VSSREHDRVAQEEYLICDTEASINSPESRAFVEGVYQIEGGGGLKYLFQNELFVTGFILWPVTFHYN